MCTTKSTWFKQSIALVIIGSTALSVCGCRLSRAPRIGSLPGVKQLAWLRDLRDRGEDEENTQLAATGPAATLPSATSTPSPPTTSLAGATPSAGPYASTVAPVGPAAGPTGYPNTTRPEVAYSGQTAGGYYTGNYDTGSASASYNNTQPAVSPGYAVNNAGVPQNGYYSAPPANTQPVYTADARSVAPRTAPSTSPPSSYGNNLPQGNPYAAPQPQVNPAPNTAPSYPVSSGSDYGSGSGSGSRYAAPSAGNSALQRNTYSAAPTGYNTTSTASAPTTDPAAIPSSAPAGYNTSANYTAPTSSLPPNTTAAPGGVPNTANLPHQPWRPGSTTDYQPPAGNQVAPTGYQAPTSNPIGAPQ